MIETRAQPRRPTNRSGQIHVNAVTVLDCIVRDFSAGGVRLELPNAAAVPAEFLLRLDGVATPRLCRLAWRRADAVGARFVSDPAE